MAFLKLLIDKRKALSLCNFKLVLAHDLCSFDEGGFHDPYVRLTISPEVDQRKRQTVRVLIYSCNEILIKFLSIKAIYRAETHPVFDQHFKFPISRDQLQGKQLVLQVLICSLPYNTICSERHH